MVIVVGCISFRLPLAIVTIGSEGVAVRRTPIAAKLGAGLIDSRKDPVMCTVFTLAVPGRGNIACEEGSNDEACGEIQFHFLWSRLRRKKIDVKNA